MIETAIRWIHYQEEYYWVKSLSLSLSLSPLKYKM